LTAEHNPLRGPGESQLELNRRSIRNQIADIERQLKIVEKNRETIREKRVDSSTFKIGLIGYTNAGEATNMNLLTEDKPDDLKAATNSVGKS